MAPRIATITVVIAALGTLAGMPAWSQTNSTATTLQTPSARPEAKLATRYKSLAGSQANASALIAGLRDGKSILLTANPAGPNPTAPSVTFTPATGKLGYGNINIALALAKADLARQGITNPTPDQLAAALNGGTITTANGTSVVMAGILAQRQAGLGWGKIANNMGVKLGSLVSQSKTDKAGKKNGPATSGDLRKSGMAGKSGQAGTNGNKGGNSNSSGGGGSHGSSSSNGGGGGGGHK